MEYDLTTYDDVIKQKRQELKCLWRLIDRCMTRVSREMLRTFVENNGCMNCRGIQNSLRTRAWSENGRDVEYYIEQFESCACNNQFNLVDSGTDPRIFAKHVHTKQIHDSVDFEVSRLKFDDDKKRVGFAKNPFIDNDMYKSLVLPLVEQARHIERELVVLKRERKIERFDHCYVVTVKNADNHRWRRYVKDDLYSVQKGEACKVKLRWTQGRTGYKRHVCYCVTHLKTGKEASIKTQTVRKLYNQAQFVEEKT